MRSGCEVPSLPPEPPLLPRPSPPNAHVLLFPAASVDRDVCGPPCLGAPFDGGLEGDDMAMVSEHGVECSCIA